MERNGMQERQLGSERELERELDKRLDTILNDPRYLFLHEHPQHLERIESAPTTKEALAIANELIAQRIEALIQYQGTEAAKGLRLGEIDRVGLRMTIEAIRENQALLGEGGDAFVVVSRNEVIEGLPEEICYKFRKARRAQEGGNTVLGETDIHDRFYRVAQLAPENRVRVPMPYYSLQTGEHEVIGMERLLATSVKDIKEGKGEVPAWFDIDEFCRNLAELLELFHREGLYHRDLHEGNVMIRQGSEPPEDGVWGYVIDFGHSGQVMVGEEPYEKHEGAKTFTYKKDDGIVQILLETLARYQSKPQEV